jgi:endo-1,4-beta-xylanase
VGVSQWGVGDADSRVPGTFPGWGAATMYDGNYQPKPAFSATLSALGGGSASGGSTGEVHAIGAGKCLDVPNMSTTPGTQLDIWSCTGGSNQGWTYTSSRQLTFYSGGSQMCLDAFNNQTTPGTKAEIWTCNGGSNQQWNLG